ncbi:MAG: MBL fold metallo-hydrolase [Myxococcales bacterium]|nr:MBL fold metallo-hydrolase [Myxococcales bacterium]
MILEHFPVGPLGCNCVILGDEETGEAIVVDPGGETDRILARLEALGLRCQAILHTHTHFDHVAGTGALQEATGASTMLHEADLFLYEGLQMQVDTFGLPFQVDQPAEVDRFLLDGEGVRAGGIEAGVLHTPGHSPGSLCFVLHDDRPIVLAGDTLFCGSVGRTDLWGGSMPAMLSSIEDKLLTLPEETLVISGHGPTTTIGREKSTNPYLSR